MPLFGVATPFHISTIKVGIYKHLMTCVMGDIQFCFPESLSPQYAGQGETKLFPVTWLKVFCYTLQLIQVTLIFFVYKNMWK